MIEQIIQENQQGQRLDKYLHKLLPEATGSFLYKMLRKKNITLNGKKAVGSEIVALHDQVQFFLSNETFDKFRGENQIDITSYQAAYQSFIATTILYEDNHILIANKESGILSQKATPEDLSINEWFIGYLLQSKQIEMASLRVFTPSICNRLDRNTSGIVLFGKTLQGTQMLSRLLKSRDLHKYYRALVPGKVDSSLELKGYLIKDERSNKVTILKQAPKDNSKQAEEAELIQTFYRPVSYHNTKFGIITQLEITLITGKTHQIRAHLASISHPIIGDYKYGTKTINDQAKKYYQIENQCLHACRIEFPKLDGEFSNLSNRIFQAELPSTMLQLIN